MTDRTKLKAIAATLAVAVVGAGAAIAATHGGGGSTSSAAANVGAAGRPGGPPGGGRGPGGGFQADLAAAATYLGTTTANLRTQLSGGKTLAQVASATSGKSTAGLIDAIVAAEKKQLTTAQSSGKLTQAQATQLLSGLTQRVTSFVDGQRPPGHFGRPPANAGQ